MLDSPSLTCLLWNWTYSELTYICHWKNTFVFVTLKLFSNPITPIQFYHQANCHLRFHINLNFCYLWLSRNKYNPPSTIFQIQEHYSKIVSSKFLHVHAQWMKSKILNNYFILKSDLIRITHTHTHTPSFHQAVQKNYSPVVLSETYFLPLHIWTTYLHLSSF